VYKRQDYNGFYNYLAVELDVNALVEGDFDIIATLYDDQGYIDSNFTQQHFEQGETTVLFRFDGQKIYQHRTDAPYNVSFILSDGLFDVHVIFPTSPYSYFEFERSEAYIIGNYIDYGKDTDNDAYYNYLTIESEIYVDYPGIYTLIGWLNEDITWAQTSTYLDAGYHMIALDFNGVDLFRSGEDGPYLLSSITLLDEDQSVMDTLTDAYQTSYYHHTMFQPADAYFLDSYRDYGVDSNEDGKYEYLAIEVDIAALTAGEYSLIGGLFSYDGSISIAFAENITYLDIGMQTMKLLFDGSEIYKHRIDGPYQLGSLILVDDESTLMDYRENAYITSPYSYTDFFSEDTQPLVKLTGNYTDYGTDTNDDGEFDFLTVDVEVLLADAGYCVITARLLDDLETEIVWASNMSYLSADGPQIIRLNFYGLYIFGNMRDGPYYVKDVYIYHTGDPNQPDYAHDAHTTQYYSYTDFQHAAILYGQVTDEQGQGVKDAIVHVTDDQELFSDEGITNMMGNYALLVPYDVVLHVTVEHILGEYWWVIKNEEYWIYASEVSVELDEDELLNLSFSQMPPPDCDECGIIPSDGCKITEDTTFVQGEYYLPLGILIQASNIVLDLNGSTIIGSSQGIGIHANLSLIHI